MHDTTNLNCSTNSISKKGISGMNRISGDFTYYQQTQRKFTCEIHLWKDDQIKSQNKIYNR